jgi:hypothetical protein
LKTSSCKAKGRRCAQEAKALLHAHAPTLEDGDIIVTPSGVTGPDLLLSPAAAKIYNFATECKNVESLNIWKAYEQAEAHAVSVKHRTATPIVFFKRNRSKLLVCISAEDFVRLTRK